MEQNKEFPKLLLQTMKVTRGRISTHEVFRDFIAYCALKLSVLTDPAHPERGEQLQKLLEKYEDNEQEAFEHAFREFASTVAQNVDNKIYDDLFSATYNECYARNRDLKQDFSPSSVAQLMTQLAFAQGVELPADGYFTANDPTCGSGTLLLTIAEKLVNNRLNPSVHLVVQASDLDICCAQMTYFHLSLYGIPAVVVHGDVLTLKEYSRWYTPAYLLGKWIWREPMPFGTARNESGERLKMLDEPMYAKFRQVERVFKKKEDESA